MKWTRQAEEAVSKVPFFIRKRVKKRVEEEAARLNSSSVTMEHVRLCQQKYLKSMEDEVKGYQLETCFGPSGCPNKVSRDGDIIQKLEAMLDRRNFKEFLKERVKGPLKLHHEFRVSVSDCPNACSRPQIADIGVIGACAPVLSSAECTACGECVKACQEDAIKLSTDGSPPEIDFSKCLQCAQCARHCPTGALVEGAQGYRIIVGGKLGRRPQLGVELSGVFSREEVLNKIEKIIDFHMLNNSRGERLGEVIKRVKPEFLS
jgi:dissimilatory sulfite reductase (desulfoviridin) alpha/beta subunit